MAKRDTSSSKPWKPADPETIKRGLVTATNYTLKGLLAGAKTAAKASGGVLSEADALAAVNGAIDEFAAAN